MSKISLAPDASGTGIFTIASPNSNTNRTLTLPDDTGTIVTNSGNQAGSFTTLNTSGAVVLNDAGADVDFRVESDTNENAFFLDGATGNIGVGVTPSASWSTANNYSSLQLRNSSLYFRSTASELYINNNAVYNGTNWLYAATAAAARYDMEGAAHKWYTAASGTAGNAITFTQAMTLDASGNLGIGTSSPATKFNVSDSSTNCTLTVTNSSSNFQVQSNSNDGYVNLNGSGNIIFRNGTPSVTERMRITSGGYLKASNTGSYNSALAGYHELRNDASNTNIFVSTHSAASDPYGGSIDFTGAAPDNNTNYFLRCSDTVAARLLIYSDGDVATSDAGTLSSDRKLKNTITDASPKLDDVMRLRVRNFYWNEDFHPEKTNKKLIGFIAQEFEEVFPGLVTEHMIRGGIPIYEDQAVVDGEGNPVLDEDGNPKTEQVQVGETEKEYAKGIREGKLIPILVKALQEAVERIETLEASNTALEARIAALETGV